MYSMKKKKKTKKQKKLKEKSELEKEIEENQTADSEFHDFMHIPSLSAVSFSTTLSKIEIPQEPELNLEKDVEKTPVKREEREPRGNYVLVRNAPDYGPAKSKEEKPKEYDKPIDHITLRSANERGRLPEQELLDRNWQMGNIAPEDNLEKERMNFSLGVEAESRKLPFEDRGKKYREVKL